MLSGFELYPRWVPLIVKPCLFYVILQSDGRAKAPCFCGKKMPPVGSWRTVTMVLPDHQVAITENSSNTVNSKAIIKEGNTRSSQKTRIYRKTPSWSLLSHNAFLHS